MAKIVDVVYKASTAMPFLVQGFKRGTRPCNGFTTVGGGNGTFVQVDPDSRADITVRLQMDDERMVDISIRHEVLGSSGRMKLTEKLAKRVIETAPRHVTVDVDEQEHVRISDDDMQKWCMKFA